MNRIDEIRKRLEAASPGPWKLEYSDGPRISRGNGLTIFEIRYAWAEADCDLIANAPDDMRYLLAEADALEHERNWAAAWKRAAKRHYEWRVAAVRAEDECRGAVAIQRHTIEELADKLLEISETARGISGYD